MGRSFVQIRRDLRISFSFKSVLLECGRKQYPTSGTPHFRRASIITCCKGERRVNAETALGEKFQKFGSGITFDCLEGTKEKCLIFRSTFASMSRLNELSETTASILGRMNRIYG